MSLGLFIFTHILNILINGGVSGFLFYLMYLQQGILDTSLPSQWIKMRILFMVVDLVYSMTTLIVTYKGKANSSLFTVFYFLYIATVTLVCIFGFYIPQDLFDKCPVNFIRQSSNSILVCQFCEFFVALLVLFCWISAAIHRATSKPKQVTTLPTNTIQDGEQTIIIEADASHTPVQEPRIPTPIIQEASVDRVNVGNSEHDVLTEPLIPTVFDIFPRNMEGLFQESQIVTISDDPISDVATPVVPDPPTVTHVPIPVGMIRPIIQERPSQPYVASLPPVTSQFSRPTRPRPTHRGMPSSPQASYSVHQSPTVVPSQGVIRTAVLTTLRHEESSRIIDVLPPVPIMSPLVEEDGDDIPMEVVSEDHDNVPTEVIMVDPSMQNTTNRNEDDNSCRKESCPCCKKNQVMAIISPCEEILCVKCASQSARCPMCGVMIGDIRLI